MSKDHPVDRRQHFRQRVARPARLSFGGSGSMPCAICDVSRFGARLEVQGAHWVVNTFDVQDVMSGVSRPGIVVWREDTRIGVRFADEGEWMTNDEAEQRAGFGRRAP